jgi:hypothetical protein
MLPRVYVETSVISYLTARASRDPIKVVASFNFKHLAGVFAREKIENTLRHLGYIPPIDCYA